MTPNRRKRLRLELLGREEKQVNHKEKEKTDIHFQTVWMQIQVRRHQIKGIKISHRGLIKKHRLKEKTKQMERKVEQNPLIASTRLVPAIHPVEEKPFKARRFSRKAKKDCAPCSLREKKRLKRGN